MTYSQLMAIVKLRWRMTSNQWRRAGKVNAWITLILLALALAGSIGSFFVAIIFGESLMTRCTPTQLLYIWDGVAGGFLFFWTIALLVELQRSEMLSLDNLLHLPVSLSGAFFLNYLSSLLSLSLMLFLPVMLGLSVASVTTLGPRMLVVFALVASFLFMVTGVTYQFRGWLGRVMQNKRKRGTVLAIVTAGFVIVFQLPNLLNIAASGERRERRRAQEAELDRRIEIVETREKEKEPPTDRTALRKLLEEVRAEHAEEVAADEERRGEQTAETVVLANVVTPLGWLPYGARAAALGNVVPGLLGAAGMFALGAGALVLSFRSTMRAYTRAGPRPTDKHTSADASSVTGPDDTARRLMERRIPMLSDQASAVMLAAMRSLFRAPESKMALLTPIIMLFVFGSMFISGQGREMPQVVRPLIALGALLMLLVGLVQFMINMFALDRHGFRAYVLMPVPRREVLIGKNLALARLVFVLGLGQLIVLQIFLRLPVTHLVATAIQMVPVFVLFVVVGNHMSITCPIAMAFGSMKPVQLKFGTMMLQVLLVLLSPLTLIPAALAYGAEMAMVSFGLGNAPVYLIISVLEAAAAVWFYRWMIGAQGEQLQSREQRILEVVAAARD